MDEHDTDVILFALLTEAQGTLNRALSYHFRQFGSVNGKMFDLHKQVADMADEYRQKVLSRAEEKEGGKKA